MNTEIRLAINSEHMDKIEPMVQDLRTISLPALQSFHTVARLGGISAAAASLGQAKSGISRHVAQLEAHFGVRLLERGARAVSLTPIGEQLDARIASILAEVNLLDDLAREESVGISGHVAIAATPEFGGLLARELFPQIRARHPELTMSMQPEYSFEDMQDASTDVAFRLGRLADDRLVVRELGAMRRVLVASPALMEEHAIHALEDLEDVPCLTFRGKRPGASWRFEGSNTDAAVDVTGPISVLSFSILMEMAKAGHCVAFLPEFMLDGAIDRGELVRVLPQHSSKPYPVYLTFRPGARRVARLDAFVTMAEEIVPGMLQQG